MATKKEIISEEIEVMDDVELADEKTVIPANGYLEVNVK